MMPVKTSQLNEIKSSADSHFDTDHLKVDIGVRTIRSSAIMLTSQMLKFTITMFSTVVLARLLTPHDYGLIGMVLVVTGFISLFKNLGFSAALIQRAELNHAQVSTLFWINLLLSIAITMFTVVLAPVIAWFYREPQLTLITIAFAIGFIGSGLGTQHEALLRRQMRFAVIAAIEVSALVTGILTAIMLARKGAGYWALIINQLVFVNVYTIGLWAFCRWRPGLPTRSSGVKSILAFGRDVTGYNILNYFTRNLDNLLVGKFWGAQQLGVYAKAYQLLLLPLDQLGVPLDGIALTSLSKLGNDADRYRNAYLRMLANLAMISMPGVALMAVTSDWLVALLLGPQWKEVGPIFAALALMGVLEPVANTMGWLMISQGRSRDYLYWGFINSTLTVLSFLIGLSWGGFGVALSFSLIGALVRTPLLFWFAGRVGPVGSSDIYRVIATPSVAAIAVVASVLFFRDLWRLDQPVVGLGACLLIAVTVSLIVYVITPQGRASIIDVKSIVGQLIRGKA